MKRPRITVAVLAVLAAGVFTPAAQSQPPAPLSPSEHHKQMAREAGVWDAEMTMWMAPGGEPMTQSAVETNTMLGSFWLLSEFKCEDSALPFTGHMQLGYDPVEKQYVGTWADTMSPYLSRMTGSYDAATHTLTMVSKGRDFATGELKTSVMVSHYIDENTKVFTIHAGEPGADGGPAPDAWKMMEIKYTRRK